MLLTVRPIASAAQSRMHYTNTPPIQPAAHGGGAAAVGAPSLVIFDKDGTLIDFQLMWGSWIENLAWNLEMESKLPVRTVLFENLGYDWMKRAIVSQGAICCTPMDGLKEIARRCLLERGMDDDAATALIEQKWRLPDGREMCRPLANLPSLFTSLQNRGIKVAVCTSDSRAPTLQTLEHLEVEHLVDAVVCGDDGFPGNLIFGSVHI